MVKVYPKARADAAASLLEQLPNLIGKRRIEIVRDPSPVRILIGSLADGMQPAEILGSYPQLSEQDLLAALAYAADGQSHELVWPGP